MRNYLEELLEGSSVLLEELRRMERNLSGLGNEESGAQDTPLNEIKRNVPPKNELVYDVKNHVYHTENVVDNSGSAQELQVNRRKKTVNHIETEEDELKSPRQLDGESEAGEERRESFPLAAQLERMERAVSALDGAASFRQGGTEGETKFLGPARRAATPVFDGTGGENVRRKTPGSASGSGRAPDWIEQADQAFRRDSRRYDGGFYLY